ncbi:hypothetical protein V5O48_013940 [Marasmius crinis-equi]|uniref:Uncharacterized protein n=1 Tax=Marasmius crinis-equi TaxID=585013 RepID=A0ABR3EYQ1_9AGAR
MWSSVHVNLFALKRDVVSVLERYLEFGYRGGGSGNGEGAEGMDITICHNNWYWNQKRTPRGVRNKTGEGFWTEHFQKAFSFLLRPENIRRFRKFDISDIDWQLPAATADAAETQMNLSFLENLFLDARTRRDLPLVGLWKSIQRAPRLRWVKLGIHMSLSTSSLTTMLAHSQIRSLEIERVAELEGDVLDVVRLLPMLSNLENLRVGYIREEGSASLQVATSVDCPNLRRLTTQFGDGPGQTVFLRGLRLPLLEFLSVTGSYSTCTFDLDTSESLISTLQNVAGTLKEFKFDHEVKSDVINVLPEILRVLPNLTRFYAKMRGAGTKCIFDLLQKLAKDSSLGSKLRCIRLEEYGFPFDFDMAERIVPLLECMGPTLKEVGLGFGIAFSIRENGEFGESSEGGWAAEGIGGHDGHAEIPRP